MNYKSDLPHRKALNSMRESVALMLQRNGIKQPSSMHHRCGMFLDLMEEQHLRDLRGSIGMDRFNFRMSPMAHDIELARAFRKLWEACAMIDLYLETGRPPQTHPMAANLWGDSRI